MFELQSPYANKKPHKYKNINYWYYRLWMTVISVRSFVGEPFENGSSNSDYFNYILHTHGYGTICRYKNTDIATRCTMREFKYNMFPRKLSVNEHQLRINNLEINKDCVLIRNNKLGLPTLNIINYYAEILGELQTSLKIALINTRSDKIYRVQNSNDAQKVRMIIDDIQDGKPAIIEDDNFINQLLGDDNKIPVFSSSSDYNLDKFLTTARYLINEFLTTLGINVNGANIVKNERNVVDEVNSNNEEIYINRSYWFEPIQTELDKYNRMFNTNIQIKYNGEGVNELCHVGLPLETTL